VRVGFGYDSHRLTEGRKLIIGGVEIPYTKGLLGHSDADVLCHAITDAVLGALGAGDIGRYFPDTDENWKDAVSTALLRRAVEMAGMDGYSVNWVDSTIVAEAPKLEPYVEEMKTALSHAGIARETINIKAKTNEGMGFIGQGEGIAAFAVCVLGKI
jgi:2-C-methyl-D-erythritol 2,4-cyclodiphosphate synthase